MYAVKLCNGRGASSKIILLRSKVYTQNFTRFAVMYSSLTPPGSPAIQRFTEKRAVTLEGQTTPPTCLLSPRSFLTTGIARVSSPCPSPPPTVPPSGYLNEAKAALEKALDKQKSKASTLSIDEDMCYMRHYYSLLGTEEREQFLLHLCMAHGTDHSVVKEMAQSSPEDNQNGAVVRWEERLRHALQPSYAWVFAQISRVEGGIKFLVDLRHHLLVVQSSITNGGDSDQHSNDSKSPSLSELEVSALRELDVTLKDMLSLWFTVGLLQLARVTWDSSCSMLQKISAYEAVHPVRNWPDLKRRVGAYRRCFVFTHSCMPGEPLVVLHTFLTDSISSSMNGIIRHPNFVEQDVVTPEERLEAMAPDVGEDPRTITAAVFYSITSTQKGLQGIELGNYLIKRVVQELQSEHHQITMFSSLSPIPGFTSWLSAVLARADKGEIKVFTGDELSNISKVLSSGSNRNSLSSSDVDDIDDEVSSLTLSSAKVFVQGETSKSSGKVFSHRDVCHCLKKMLCNNKWANDPVLRAYLEKPFTRLCAYYLYREKRRGYALNSVAHFHLKNGAVMWRVNFEADMSSRGLTNSCGLMVNYRYFLQDSESNSRLYQEHQRITADENVKALAQEAATVMGVTDRITNVADPA